MILELQKPIQIEQRDDLPMESTELYDVNILLVDQCLLGDGLPKVIIISRIDSGVKAFATGLFKIGMADITKKVKPAAAVLQMQNARNPDGTPKFPLSTWINEKQVKVFYKTLLLCVFHN